MSIEKSTRELIHQSHISSNFWNPKPGKAKKLPGKPEAPAFPGSPGDPGGPIGPGAPGIPGLPLSPGGPGTSNPGFHKYLTRGLIYVKICTYLIN